MGSLTDQDAKELAKRLAKERAGIEFEAKRLRLELEEWKGRYAELEAKTRAGESIQLQAQPGFAIELENKLALITQDNERLRSVIGERDERIEALKRQLEGLEAELGRQASGGEQTDHMNVFLRVGIAHRVMMLV